jgi:hypothetical protein
MYGLTECKMKCCQWTAVQQATCLNVRPAVYSVSSILWFGANCNVFTALEWRVDYLLSYWVKCGSYWEADRFSASQEIPRNLWNQTVCYRIHKCASPFHIFSQINPLRSPSHFQVIVLNIIHLSLPVTKRSVALWNYMQNPFTRFSAPISST